MSPPPLPAISPARLPHFTQQHTHAQIQTVDLERESGGTEREHQFEQLWLRLRLSLDCEGAALPFAPQSQSATPTLLLSPHPSLTPPHRRRRSPVLQPPWAGSQRGLPPRLPHTLQEQEEVHNSRFSFTLTALASPPPPPRPTSSSPLPQTSMQRLQVLTPTVLLTCSGRISVHVTVLLPNRLQLFYSHPLAIVLVNEI